MVPVDSSEVLGGIHVQSTPSGLIDELLNLPSNLHAYLARPVIVTRRIFKMSPASLGQSEFRRLVLSWMQRCQAPGHD